MTRIHRNKIMTVWYIVGLTASLTLHCSVNQRTLCALDRPNIVWITIEDMSPVLGCYGDEYAETPNIDRLAEESVRYTNCFATSPVCSPSRSTLITGVYSTSLGTHDLRSAFPIPEFVRAWPAILRDEGYFTSNNEKTDYNTSDEQRLITEAWNAQGPTAHWRDRQPDQPFFAVFNDMTTHQSRAGVWPDERFQSEIQSRLDAAARIHDPSRAPVPPYYPDTAEIREGIARFYDCVSLMDQNVGVLIEQLKADGIYDETIIFLYSDHGTGMPRGKRTLYDSGMRVPLLIRFPDKYRYLATGAPGTTTDRLVSFVDFPPSLLSLLGLEIPEYMQGSPFLGQRIASPRRYVFGARDRVDEAYDKSRSVRSKEFLYIRNYRPDLSLNQPSLYSDFSEVRQTITRLNKDGELNTIQALYAAPRRPAEELYDVTEDPHNIVNLAGRPEHQAVLERLRGSQMDWITSTRDLGFYSEESLRQVSENARSPYEWARQMTVCPSGELLKAADLIGRGTDTSDDLIALLAHEDADVRLQAIMGLKSIPLLSPRARAAVRKLLESPEESAVHIEATSLLAEVDALGRVLHSDDENLVLRSSRALELLGERSRNQTGDMQAALAKWKTRQDSPIPLFIRFALEAALTRLGLPPADPFLP